MLPNFSVRIEGLYTNCGTHQFVEDLVGPYWQVRPRTLEARIGMTYHFH